LDPHDKRYCLKCGYDLWGLKENRCPECGSEFDPADPATFADSRLPRVRLRPILLPLCNRYVCMALILTVATALYLVARSRTFSQPLPLPLKSPLGQLSEKRLPPYRIVQVQNFGRPLSIVDQPPLDDYACWSMQDGDGRPVSLMVTYSSASLDRPMHVVHASFLGDGTSLVARTKEIVAITCRGYKITVPLEVRELEKPTKDALRTWIVVRTCCANGEFSSDARGAARILYNSNERYAYFSQVDASMQLDSQTTREQAIESVERFLQVVIPVLLEDHWPDWENRPIPPPSWFPWLPATSRPSPTTQASA
jgi:hypothetical protein